jgi:class 3 adenylate cyclase/tetratricopeptide (TPR) repeat protein
VGAADRIETYASYVPRVVLDRVASTSAGDGRIASADAERFPAALVLVDIAGFTPLTATAVRRGPAGAEQLSRSLNAYFGQIIDLVVDHGGDVAKIVGDALISIWPARDGDLATATLRAAECGLAIASQLAEVEIELDLRLSIKVGIGAGEVAAAHVGAGDARRWFVIAGDAVSQLAPLTSRLRTAATVASPQAWELIANRFVGHEAGAGHVQLEQPTTQFGQGPREPRELSAAWEQGIRAYVPEVCLSRLDAGQTDWLVELRNTSVVFISVRGIGGATPAAIDALQHVALASQQTLARYRGWLKEITMDEKGTSIVGVFGVPPFTHVDDPARAVGAAQAILADVGAQGLEAGAGVTTGLALCGPVGNDRRRDFAVLGPHVNLASRLGDAADDQVLLCDAATREGSDEARTYERLPAYVLKGVGTPIDVYRVRHVRSVTGLPATMINRALEMQSAASALEALRRGEGQLVELEGEPGIGKSRLVQAWLEQAREAGVRCLIGSAEAIEESTPYHAWRQVFRDLLGMTGATTPAARAAVAQERIREAGANPRLTPLLDQVLSLDLPDNEDTEQLAGEARADNIRSLLIALLRHEADRGPLMIVLEDTHWMDSASWSLTLRVRSEIPSLLLLLTTHPRADTTADPLAPIRHDATTLWVGALSAEHAAELACERTGATRLAEPVAAVVRSRAAGNPLFIEHLTYAMRDSGRVVVENGECRPAPGIEDLSLSTIPDTVQRVITTRLDQLPPGEAMTLKVASVVGQRFAVRALGDVYPIPVDADVLLRQLETLTRLDLVAPVPVAPEPTFGFRHAITQEVAYGLMPPTQTQHLHRSLAEWYERNYADDLSPFHAFLAYHWRRAGAPDKAVEHLEAAGERALRSFANEEAVGFFGNAIALDDEASLGIDADRRARWHLQLGDAFVNMSRYREGREHLELGLRLMGRPAPATHRQQTTGVVGQIVRQGLRRLGLIRSVRTLSAAEREELVLACRALERLAEASFYGRETLLPLYCTVRILNDAEASGSPPEIARGFAGTGALLGVVPYPRIAEWYLRRSLDLLSTVEDVTTHEIVQIVAGFYAVGAGQWDVARERFNSVRRIARRLGDRRRLDDSVGNLMELEYLQGSYATAARLADELMSSSTDRHDQRFASEALEGAAYSHLMLGDHARVRRSLEQLRGLVVGQVDLSDDIRTRYYGLLSLWHLERGERQPAVAAAEEAMRMTAQVRPSYFGSFLGYVGPAEVFLNAWEAGQPVHDAQARTAEAVTRLHRFAKVFPIGRPRAGLLQGRHDWQLGKHRLAFHEWRSSLSTARALSMPYEEALAQYEIGRHLDMDDETRAGYLEGARAILADLGAMPALARVQTEIDTNGGTG